MKPTNSLSKSMKKSSKTRSKLSKSATTSLQASLHHHHQQQQQATITHQEPATPTTVQDLPKEKAHHRSYAGFGPKSIKIIWEQHDTSDTDVLADVYSRLAEDVTYKVWELVNNVKTYARHSGGRVTVDLVNEVLKDSDVPPVIGAADTEWDKIEYDGIIFFNTDNVLELRDEYLKEIEPQEIYESKVISTWSGDKSEIKTLFAFYSSLCNAVILGDDEAYNYAIEIATKSSYIGCTLKLILRKCIEVLAFEQKFPIIERCLEFLKVISLNPFTRCVDCNESLFHLCEIIICLLMGTFDSIKPPPSLVTIKMENKKQEESFELVKSFLENSDQETIIKKDTVTFNTMDVDDLRNEYEELFQMMARDGFQERDNSEIISPIITRATTATTTTIMTNTTQSSNAINNIKMETTASTLLSSVPSVTQPQIMGPPPPPPPLPPQTVITPLVSPLASLNHVLNTNEPQLQQQGLPSNIRIKEEKVEPIFRYDEMQDDQGQQQQHQQEQQNQQETQHQEEEQQQQEQPQQQRQIKEEQEGESQEEENQNNEIFSPYHTQICDFKNADLIATTIGYMASQFGYFKNECTFLIQRRMEKFFSYRETVTCEKDFEFISRCVKGLISLGEYAFREIIPFLDKIDPLNAPEWINNDFSVAGIFLKGKDDIFLYEWLEELCGDQLQPFYTYSYNYHQKLMTKLYKSIPKPLFIIKPKIFLKQIEKKTKTVKNKNTTMDIYFPEKSHQILKLSSQLDKKIKFNFAGSHQIENIKIKKENDKNNITSLTDRKIINNKVLLCKRKLMKTLTSNKMKISNLSNFSYLQI